MRRYLRYSPFICWNVVPSGRNTRALTTLACVRPAAARSSPALSRTTRVCSGTSPDTNELSRPLREMRPDMNSVSPVRIP